MAQDVEVAALELDALTAADILTTDVVTVRVLVDAVARGAAR